MVICSLQENQERKWNRECEGYQKGHTNQCHFKMGYPFSKNFIIPKFSNPQRSVLKIYFYISTNTCLGYLASNIIKSEDEKINAQRKVISHVS